MKPLRPRELLLFLLLHPEGASKEQVGVALWPDASASQLRNSFHVTLHRLRKVLGDPSLVQLSGRNRRKPTGTGTSFRASVTDTSVWQFALLPSIEAYCGATPTE